MHPDMTMEIILDQKKFLTISAGNSYIKTKFAGNICFTMLSDIIKQRKGILIFES